VPACFTSSATKAISEELIDDHSTSDSLPSPIADGDVIRSLRERTLLQPLAERAYLTLSLDHPVIFCTGNALASRLQYPLALRLSFEHQSDHSVG